MSLPNTSLDLSAFGLFLRADIFVQIIMVGLIIASIPSWILLYDTESMTIWILLGLGLLFTSRMMYTTLVHHTGAIPSEYYSLKKRPDYKTYQETTNIFFPGPKK